MDENEVKETLEWLEEEKRSQEMMGTVSGFFQKYPTQQRAFAATAESKDELHVWSEEKAGDGGKRAFCAASREEFARRYLKKVANRETQFWYELIREQPCRLCAIPGLWISSRAPVAPRGGQSRHYTTTNVIFARLF